MDSLGNILGSKDFAPPPEIETIQTFVNDHFGVIPAVQLQTKQIVITVPNGALAGALRMQLHQLEEELQTDKRLIIRIG